MEGKGGFSECVPASLTSTVPFHQIGGPVSNVVLSKSTCNECYDLFEHGASSRVFLSLSLA